MAECIENLFLYYITCTRKTRRKVVQLNIYIIMNLAYVQLFLANIWKVKERGKVEVVKNTFDLIS